MALLRDLIERTFAARRQPETPIDGIERVETIVGVAEHGLTLSGFGSQSGGLYDKIYSSDEIIEIGYRRNAIVFGCVSTLAFAFPEASVIVTDGEGGPMPTHPVQQILDGNFHPDMLAQEDLWTYAIIYAALGGVCYLEALRNEGGRLLAFQPHHRSKVKPLRNPKGPGLVGWRYFPGDGTHEDVPVETFIPLYWPSLDPKNPYEPVSPLQACGREIGMANEAMKYGLSLLENDAVPRTVFSMRNGQGVIWNPADASAMVEQYREMFDKYNRGLAAVLPPGMNVDRLALNMEELAFEALHRLPEARIAHNFRTPAELVGLNVGLENSTYANKAEARKSMTEMTLVPLWRRWRGRIQQALRREIPGDWLLEHDTSQVIALKEDEDGRARRRAELSKRVEELQVAAAEITREAAMANAKLLLELPEEAVEELFPEPEEEEPPIAPSAPIEGDPTEQDPATDDPANDPAGNDVPGAPQQGAVGAQPPAGGAEA